MAGDKRNGETCTGLWMDACFRPWFTHSTAHHVHVSVHVMSTFGTHEGACKYRAMFPSPGSSSLLLTHGHHLSACALRNSLSGIR